MANQVASRTLRTRGGSGSTQSYTVDDTNVIFNGQPIWFNRTTGRCTSIPLQPSAYATSGALTPAQANSPLTTDLSNKKFEFLGIASPPGDSITGNTAGTVLCPVSTGGVIVEGVAVATSTLVGDPVYMIFNNFDSTGMSKAVASGTRRSVGYVIAWTSATQCDVQLWDKTVNRLFMDAAIFTHIA